jgi:peptidoglycan/LPS O-acetylase OafA/YrhL
MNRIPELDGIRGIAILLVIVWHYVVVPGITSNSEIVAVGLNLLGNTWSGVDLFFVLSGFLIGGILIDNRDARNYFKTFYLRRFFRIVPLYFGWIALFILLTAILAKFVFIPEELATNAIPLWTYFTFTQNIAMALQGEFGGEWLAVTWSLAIEEQFYLIMPLFVLLVPKKHLPWITIVLVVSVLFMRRLHLAIFWTSLGLYVFAPYRADALLLGVLCAWIVRQERWRAWLERRTIVLYIPMIILMGYWVQKNLRGYGGQITSYTTTMYGYTILALMYALFLLIAVVERKGIVKTITRLGFLRLLGTLAYGIYLFHQTVNILMHHFLIGSNRTIETPLDGLITLAAFGVTVGLAYLSWTYFEKPLVAIGHRFRYEPRKIDEQPSVQPALDSASVN